MQAVILAAGKSSRFEPFTSLPHKSMVKILGKTILEHTLLSLKKSNVDDVILVVGDNDAIQKEIGDGERLGLKITYVMHIGAQGMGAALLDAKEYLQEKFFLLNAYHMDVEKFSEGMIEVSRSDETVVLLGKKPQDSQQFGMMEINGETVTGVVEKPEKVLDNQLQIIGMYLLTKKFVEVLESTPLEHYHFEKALDMYAKNGNVKFVRTNEATLSLKYAWDLLQVKNYLLSSLTAYISPTAKVSEHAVITGNVYIDDEAEVMDGAVIKGPAYIGKKALVGTDAILRNGVDVEAGAVVGARMELKNCLMGESATTHSGFLGDSIVGTNVKIAAYVCSANARLDRQPVMSMVKGEKVSSGLKHLGVIVGENANIGIRVSTMPGNIIGEGAIIGPSTTVMKNIAPHTKYYTRFAEVIEDAK